MAEDIPQPKTQQLPAADKQDIQFAELKNLITTLVGSLDAKVAVGFKDVNIKVAQLYDWKTDIHGWKEDVDLRLGKNSMRARAPSTFDLEQDAKLAQTLAELAEEKAKREALEKVMATKSDLQAVADAQTKTLVASLTAATENPWVRRLGTALAGLLIVLIGAATTYVSTKAAQQQQPPTIVQVPK